MTALVSFFDTATEPTDAMREAMRVAAVGDDVYGRDPTVRELELRSAALLGKEASVFLPTGTMANLAAILAQTNRGDAVVGERASHLVRAETGGISAVAGCLPVEVPGVRGVLRAADVEARLGPPDQHRAPVRLLCVENTHNRGGGTVTPPEVMRELRAVCDRWGMLLHVDGARLFNAAVALDVPPAELVGDAHSACFAVSKALGAPVGSLLAGTHEFVGEARRMRKMLGGGMRQSGVLAAAALVALDGWEERLAEDHRRAVRLAERLAGIPGLAVDPGAVQTNIVMCDLDPAVPAAAQLVGWLEVRGISCATTSPHGLRFVLHGQIGDLHVERLVEALDECVAGVLGGAA